MKKRLSTHIRWAVLGALFAGVLVFRFCPGTGEVYARTLYPSISWALSFVASAFPFSLEEVLAVSVAVGVVAGTVVARKRHVAWRRIGAIVVETALWIYVWFYWGWGMNYFRDSLLVRTGTVPSRYEETEFKRFLADYTERLNAAYLPERPVDVGELETTVKKEFCRIDKTYGLTRPAAFQHPKRSFCNALYSGVGVLGYMGPFFAESHLNHDLLPQQLPFTYAHELSHLLGVSSEAEANYWAYQVCVHSADAYLRYCGYYGLFGYVLANARGLLSEADYEQWIQTVREEVKTTFMAQRSYWREKYSPTLGAVQDKVYHLYLKGNNIPSGKKNYAQVVGLLMALPDVAWK